MGMCYGLTGDIELYILSTEKGSTQSISTAHLKTGSNAGKATGQTFLQSSSSTFVTNLWLTIGKAIKIATWVGGKCFSGLDNTRLISKLKHVYREKVKVHFFLFF